MTEFYRRELVSRSKLPTGSHNILSSRFHFSPNDGLRTLTRNSLWIRKKCSSLLWLVLGVVLEKGLLFTPEIELITDHLSRLGWAQMNLILAKMIWSFDLELMSDNKEDWDDQKIWILHERVPLNVKISPRF